MVRTGTCPQCQTVYALVKGKLIQHRVAAGQDGTRNRRAARCPGSERTSEEILAKNRERAQKKKLAAHYALIASWRDNASVMLDALLIHDQRQLAAHSHLVGDAMYAAREQNKCDYFGAEFDRSDVLRVALKGYRLEHPKVQGSVSRGLLWVNGRKEHLLYCRFCGHRVAKLELGQWSKSTAEEQFDLVGKPVLICALQFLAGIRQIVSPGTRIDVQH